MINDDHICERHQAALAKIEKLNARIKELEAQVPRPDGYYWCMSPSKTKFVARKLNQNWLIYGNGSPVFSQEHVDQYWTIITRIEEPDE